MSAPVVILGVDPGGKCGLALAACTPRGVSVLAIATVSLSSKRGRARLMEIAELAVENGAVGYAIEKRWGGQKAGRTEATGYRILGAQGESAGRVKAHMELVGLRALPPVVVASAKKSLTGSGRASKADMIRMAEAIAAPLIGDEELDEHAADALGVALAAYDRLRMEQTTRRR